MTITKALFNDFLKDSTEIKLVKVIYSSNEVYEGSLKKFQSEPLEAIISLRKPININNKLHCIDFERVKEMVFYFFDKRISAHNEILIDKSKN